MMCCASLGGAPDGAARSCDALWIARVASEIARVQRAFGAFHSKIASFRAHARASRRAPTEKHAFTHVPDAIRA
jgi:hypothetical protein